MRTPGTARAGRRSAPSPWIDGKHGDDQGDVGGDTRLTTRPASAPGRGRRGEELRHGRPPGSRQEDLLQVGRLRDHVQHSYRAATLTTASWPARARTAGRWRRRPPPTARRQAGELGRVDGAGEGRASCDARCGRAASSTESTATSRPARMMPTRSATAAPRPASATTGTRCARRPPSRARGPELCWTSGSSPLVGSSSTSSWAGA